MPYTTTAKQLFDSVVPGFLATAPSRLAESVQFDIEGSAGGAWVVDFGARTVRAGKATTPVKAIVRAQERDFMALVEGRMSPDDGVLTRRLHVAGDAAVLGHLLAVIDQLRAAATSQA